MKTNQQRQEHAGERLRDAEDRIYEDRLRRVEQANELIEAVARLGGFFRKGEIVARFRVDHRGHVWLQDDFTREWIYTHDDRHRSWRHFNHGGGLKHFILQLKRFIFDGVQLCEDFFDPETGAARHWGYGEALTDVEQAARELAILAEPNNGRS